MVEKSLGGVYYERERQLNFLGYYTSDFTDAQVKELLSLVEQEEDIRETVELFTGICCCGE